MATLYLLGPQRPVVNLDRAFPALDGERPVAVISAGWQDAEADIEHVRAAVPRPLSDLRLYRRAEEVFAKDTWLRSMYRARQDRLVEQQRLYRLRLRPHMLVARKLLRDEGDAAMLRHEQRHAISQLRALDRHHLQRLSAINARFEAEVMAEDAATLERHRSEIAYSLDKFDTVLITGGNVAVLLNRLRLFRMQPMLEDKNIVAWSAGAMALSDNIVLFHDKTPLGSRDAEAFERGLGLVKDTVFLPDARHRLTLEDKARVALFCRRFAPAACLTLDSGSLLRFESGKIDAAENVHRLSRSGGLRKVRIR